MVRLFLDAHLSSHALAVPLRTRAYDVRCVDEERALDALDDEPLLSLATGDERVLVTANVKDFLPILAAWAEVPRHHAGCILIPRSIGQNQFGLILARLIAVLEDVPEQSAWRDRVHWLAR